MKTQLYDASETARTDGDRLLASIAAHPEEDTPRLMYADWLDENDQPERADFIRLQIALAWPDSELPRCVACNGTKRVTVMAYPEAAYDPDPHEVETDCKECVCRKKHVKTGTNRNAMQFRVAALWNNSVWEQLKSQGVNVVHAEPAAPIIPPSSPTVVVARGLAEALYLPTLADLCEWNGATCGACAGRRRIFTAAARRPVYQIANTRQLVMPIGEPIEIQCPTCEGRGYTEYYTDKPTALALDIIRAHPTITRVVVGDVIRGSYLNLSQLPREIIQTWELFPEEGLEPPTALAICLGQWLRRKAGHA